MATVYEVENGMIKMRASNRSCPGCPEAMMVASTFPLVPNGTTVYELTIKAPEGMHVVLFKTMTTQPRVIGHGKATQIYTRIEEDGDMLFIWKEGDKTIAKVEEYLKPVERGIFNPFVMHNGDLTISDSVKLVVYHTSRNPETSDPKWTYKRVSPDDAVRYVAKMITLAELDERATLERVAGEELKALREASKQLELEREGRRAINEALDRLEERLRVCANHIKLLTEELDEAKAKLASSECELEREAVKYNNASLKFGALQRILKHVPAWLRPKFVSDFLSGMDDIVSPPKK